MKATKRGGESLGHTRIQDGCRAHLLVRTNSLSPTSCVLLHVRLVCIVCVNFFVYIDFVVLLRLQLVVNTQAELKA